MLLTKFGRWFHVCTPFDEWFGPATDPGAREGRVPRAGGGQEDKSPVHGRSEQEILAHEAGGRRDPHERQEDNQDARRSDRRPAGEPAEAVDRFVEPASPIAEGDETEGGGVHDHAEER